MATLRRDSVPRSSEPAKAREPSVAAISNPTKPRRAHRYGLSTAEGIEDGRGGPKFSSRLFDLACCVWRAKRLRRPTLALLQLGLDRLQSVYLVRLLDRRDLANHPVESGLVQLSLRI